MGGRGPAAKRAAGQYSSPPAGSPLSHRPRRSSSLPFVYRVIAVIKPFRLDAVVEALRGRTSGELEIEEVRGFGLQKGHLEQYAGQEYSIDFLPRQRSDKSFPGIHLTTFLSFVTIWDPTGSIPFDMGVLPIHWPRRGS